MSFPQPHIVVAWNRELEPEPKNREKPENGETERRSNGSNGLNGGQEGSEGISKEIVDTRMEERRMDGGIMEDGVQTGVMQGGMEIPIQGGIQSGLNGFQSGIQIGGIGGGGGERVIGGNEGGGNEGGGIVGGGGGIQGEGEIQGGGRIIGGNEGVGGGIQGGVVGRGGVGGGGGGIQGVGGGIQGVGGGIQGVGGGIQGGGFQGVIQSEISQGVGGVGGGVQGGIQGGGGGIQGGSQALVVHGGIQQNMESGLEMRQEHRMISKPPMGTTVVKRRALQNVTSKASQHEVIMWMMDDVTKNGETQIATRAIALFPECFRGTYKANHMKASRWWKNRLAIIEAISNQRALSARTVGHRIKFLLKALPGRGRKTAPWVEYVYNELMEDFTRFKKAGIKLSSTLLGTMGRDVINRSETEFNPSYVDKDGKLIITKITNRWIQQFQEKKNIVIQTQAGKLLCSPEKESHIEMLVAFHMGELQRGFEKGEIDENLVENIDELHFIVNLDSGRTLGFRGDEEVKYEDVVPGGESMTMILRITGGASSHIEAPMIVFTDKNRTYPLEGLEDDVVGASYRTSPKGWNDMKVFTEWLDEPRAYQEDPYSRVKYLFLDNCAKQKESQALGETLSNKRTVLRFFPPCATHLVQPADLLISRIKEAWTNRWDEKKLDMLNLENWSRRVQKEGGWSGELSSPGKRFFLQLAADSIREVNSQRDVNGLTHSRKAMIQCGLARDVDGRWHVEQLTPQLQDIIRKYRSYFDGERVSPLLHLGIPMPSMNFLEAPPAPLK